MHLGTYLEFLRHTEDALGGWYRTVSAGHVADADVHFSTARFAGQCGSHSGILALQVRRFDPPGQAAIPPGMQVTVPDSHRDGPAGLLRDLLEAYQLAGLIGITWALVRQAAQGARDADLLDAVDRCEPETAAQLAWLRMTVRGAAPQTLLVAD